MQNDKKENLLYENESYKIRGACFNVYNALGGGIKEEIIHRSLYHELCLMNLTAENKKQIDIKYKDKKVGIYFPDIVVSDKIIIELKSKPFISEEDNKQFWGYLKGSKYKLGFLINFSPQKLFIRRFIHTNKTLSA